MRVRFAPSPTGALHIGGARTALYNWLTARHAGATLVLRIEDTDRERSTPANVEQILQALRWLELDWDEGPMFQSQRSERHREALEALLANGHAYRSTATAEDVRAYKAAHGAERGFRGVPEDEGAVRLRVPDPGETVVNDMILGEVRTDHAHLADAVIARFDIARVSRNPARFDEQKLRWLNGRYVRAMSTAELTRGVEDYTGRPGLGGLVEICQEKMQTLADFWPLAGPVLDGPIDDPAARERWLGPEGRAVLSDVRAALGGPGGFGREQVEEALRAVVERRGVKPKDVFQPLRVALTGTTVSPGIFETVALLGRDETLRRIDAALADGAPAAA